MTFSAAVLARSLGGAAEQKKKIQGETLRDVLEGSPIGAAVSEVATGERLSVNSALVKMFKAATHDDLITGDIKDTWTDQNDLARAFGIFKSDERLVNFEARRKRLDGSD
ncbi:MAG: hypothetical protein VW268_12035 [Rhodospirillaceae bacterium]